MNRSLVNRICPAIRTYLFTAVVAAVSVGIPIHAASAQSATDDAATVVPQWLRGRLADRLFHRRDNADMVRLVQPLAEELSDSVVGILSGGRVTALGTVVADPLGDSRAGDRDEAYVITKRSELSADPIRIRTRDGQLIPARIAAVRRRSDLALLVVQIDRESVWRQLRPVQFSTVVPEVGSFLVSPERTGEVVGIGVVGTGPRAIEHRGRLGVQLERISKAGAVVRRILRDSGADAAGLETGDRIVAIDGHLQEDIRTVVDTLNSKYPGEEVQLTIERGGSTVDISARLSELALMQETENDARVNGPRNVRLSGFDRVVQHDTVLNPDQCGGPIVDLQGRVVGVNIARAGRVVSYALPSGLVAKEVTSMIAEASRK